MNPMVVSALGSFFRWAFTFAAAWFVQQGIWSASESELYVGKAAVGAAIATVTLTWELWNKYHGRIKFLTALQMPAGATEHDVEQRIADPRVPNPSVTTSKTDQP